MTLDQTANTIYSAMKAQAWELAKGNLRALVKILGSVPSTDASGDRQWQALDAKVEAFILDVEDEGLHE
jgi:hypothetical protein